MQPWSASDHYPLCVENPNADQTGHHPHTPVPSGITPTSPHHVLGPMTTSARRMTPLTIRRTRSQFPTFRVISYLLNLVQWPIYLEGPRRASHLLPSRDGTIMGGTQARP